MTKHKKNMCVVLFSDGNGRWECKHLKAVLKSVVPERSLEVFKKFEDFSVRIRRFPRDIDVAVLAVQNDYQLTALLSLADYLDSVRIILILPDRKDCMLGKGHLLRPRFVAINNGDLSGIAAVLSKMLQNRKSYRPIGEKR